METTDPSHQHRGRTIRIHGAGRRPTSKNKHWIAGLDGASGSGRGGDVERWERGGRRGRGRGKPNGHVPSQAVDSPHTTHDDAQDEEHEDGDLYDDDRIDVEVEDQDPETPEEREKFYQELVKAREIERKRAIAEQKMDDPLVPKRLDEAITMVGTCMDMCPRFERYRRERENNLDKWEVIPGTKRVDHKHAVKIYERAAGDKTLPSDLRPPPVLKTTLDYLFHDLLVRGGFSQTYSFIRDRSRAVRNDFTMQHETGALAIECHDRCARFHILALHLERESVGFSIELEEQQLMNTLQSLKQFYEDQRGRYQASTELEMRVYHRLIHIRDQRERHEEIPKEITSHPVFQLTTKFRLHVQAQSAPIKKSSPLVVDEHGMEIFAELAAVLREQNDIVMIYLVACILERLFGKDAIDDIEAIRGDLTIPEIIDGISRLQGEGLYVSDSTNHKSSSMEQELSSGPQDEVKAQPAAPLTRNATEWLSSNFGSTPSSSTLNPLVKTPSATFGNEDSSSSSTATPAKSVFEVLASNAASTSNAFGISGTQNPAPMFGSTPPKSAFGQPSASSQGNPLFGTASTYISFPLPNRILTPISSPTPQHAENVSGSIPSPSLAQTNTPIPFGNQSCVGSSPSHPISPSSSVLDPSATSFTPPSLAPSFNATPSATPLLAEPMPARFQHASTTPSDTPSTRTSQLPTNRITTSQLPPLSIPTQVPVTPRSESSWNFQGLLRPADSRNDDASPKTPRSPPALGKIPPISLPPTPSVRWFDPSSHPQLQNKQVSDSLRKKSILNLQMPGAVTPAEILSPLQIHSPTTFKGPPVPIDSPSPMRNSFDAMSGTLSDPHQGGSNGLGLDGLPSPFAPKTKNEDVPANRDALATEFSRKRLIRRAFNVWLKVVTDRAAWIEACRRSEVYKEKLQRQRLSGSIGSGSNRQHGPDVLEGWNRSLASSTTSMESIKSRRVRKRVSSQYRPPLTDEELAQHLKENHNEHERRWARGTFLDTLRTRVRAATPDGEYPSQWRVWLATNPENDGTAIWLEHKFDVPNSGEWLFESVFSMPLIPKSLNPPSPGSPGVIVFERLPLNGLTDEIERKYRILDDCARLRDIMQELQPEEEQHFIPSLLVISWMDDDYVNSSPEFRDMTEQLVHEQIIHDVQMFNIPSTAKDLDGKFQAILASIKFDVEDRLAVNISWKDLAKRFEEPFRNVTMDWLISSWIDDEIDWIRFSQVMQSIRDVSSIVLQTILGLFGVETNTGHCMPIDTGAIAALGQGHAAGPFLDAAAKWPIITAEHILGDQIRPRNVLLKSQLTTALRKVDDVLQLKAHHLRELEVSRRVTPPLVHPSPKRRLDEVDGNLDSVSSNKRRRKSSVTGDEDDETSQSTSPPPSTAASVGTTGIEKPLITVAMLRALAHDVIKTYSGRSS